MVLTLLVAGRAQQWASDPTFAPALEGSAAGSVSAYPYPGGKVLVTSSYAVVNGRITNGHLIRLNSDGTIDEAFQTPGYVRNVLLVYPDGRILFSAPADTDTATQVINRVLGDGSFDPSFTPTTANYDLERAILLPAERILLYGGFSAVGGVPRQKLAVLNTDGSLASDFQSPLNNNAIAVHAAVRTADGQSILISGSLGLGAGVRVARLDNDGTLDPGFNSADAGISSPGEIYPAADGSLLVVDAGSAIVRLGSTGAKDPSFVPALPGSGRTFGAQQPDGKIFYTTVVIGSPSTRQLRRMNLDGSDDPSLVISTPHSSSFAVSVPVLNDDGTFLFGALTQARHDARFMLTRVLADGTIDPDYNPRFSRFGTISAFARQSDGKILISGAIDHVNNVAISGRCFVRFNPDGSLDSSFNTSLAVGSISRLEVLADGRILALGSFPIGGGSYRGAKRFLANGTEDSSYQSPPEASFTTFVRPAVDEMGRLYQVDGGGSPALRRYLADGQLDASFQAQALVGTPVGIAPLPDGSVWLAWRVGSNSTTLTHLLPNGVEDPAVTPFSSAPQVALASLPDGRVVFCEQFTGAQMGATFLRIRRLCADGTFDYSYTSPYIPQIDIATELAGVLLDLVRQASPTASASVAMDLSATTASVVVECHSEGEALLLGTIGLGSYGLPLERFSRTGSTGPGFNAAPIEQHPLGNLLHRPLDSFVTVFPRLGGLEPFTYQWLKNGEPLPTQTGAQLRLAFLQAGDAGAYAVRVTNLHGSVTSTPFSLTVDTAHASARIVTPPVSQTVEEGGTATFTVVATGNPTPAYQWRFNGNPIPGATSPTLVLQNVQPANDGIYTVSVNNTVVNAGGSFGFGTTSEPAYLDVTLLQPPTVHLTLSDERVLGNTLSIMAQVDSAQYAFANLWVHTPGRGWLTIKADNSVVVSGDLSSGNSVVPAAGAYSRTFTFTAVDGVGDYRFVLQAADTRGLLSTPVSQTITVTRPTPTGSFTLSSERTVGQTIAVHLDVAPMGSSLRFANLWVRTPQGTWLTIRGDNTVVPSGELSAANNSLAGTGPQSRTFFLAPEYGVGDYRFMLQAVDASGVLSVPASQTITVTGPGNRAPTAAFTFFSSQRSIGQTMSVNINVYDPDYNLAFANLWVNTPNRGWRTIKADNSVVASGELTAANNSITGPGEQTRTFAFTELDGIGDYRFMLQAADAAGVLSTVVSETISVASAGIAPVITQQPRNASVMLGGSTSMTVAAIGTPAPFYRWQRLPAGTATWQDIPEGGGSVTLGYADTTFPTLNIVGMTLQPQNGDRFRCVVSNAAGEVISNEATLTVTDPTVNSVPTVSVTLSGERTVGETVSVNLNVNDVDGNLSFANLWVHTPGRGWLTVKADNNVVASGALSSANNSITGAGTQTRTFTFTPADGAGTYRFLLQAADAAGALSAVASESITVVAAANAAPTAFFTLSSARAVGQTVSVNLNVNDVDGNLSFANLWVHTPGRGWLTVKADNNVVASGALSSANNSITGAGAQTRTFTFTPADGAGTYRFLLQAADTAGALSAVAGETITVTPPLNAAPTATFTLSDERSLGQTVSVTLNVNDADGNLSFANLWVHTPGRGWLTIKADNSVVVSGDLASANNSIVAAGVQTRVFNLTSLDGPGEFRFVLQAADSSGALSAVASETITVNGTRPPLWIVGHPRSITVADGFSAEFHFAVVGDGPYTVEWQHAQPGSSVWIVDGTTGPSTNSIMITSEEGTFLGHVQHRALLASSELNGVRVRARAITPFGDVTSNEAILTVTGAGVTAPTIFGVVPPDPLGLGEVGFFSAFVRGSQPQTYQWQVQPFGTGTWQDLVADATHSGVNGMVMRVVASGNLHGNRYRFIATNGAGSATSDAVVLTIRELNRNPVASFTLSSVRTLGQTLSIDLNTNDPDGNLRFANLWVQTPNRGWVTILANNIVVVSGALDPMRTSITGPGLQTRSFTFTPTDGVGTYRFAFQAVDTVGALSAVASETITVVPGPNTAPTASFFLSTQRTMGQTISVTMNVDDAEGNLAFANLWVSTPGRGWLTIKADNSVVVSGDLASANNSINGPGIQTRTFTFTAADGPGDYRFFLQAADVAGALSAVASQTITVTNGSGMQVAVRGSSSSFEAWRQAKFTPSELVDPTVSGPDAIYGTDGLTNLLKYALGLDPKENETGDLGETLAEGSEWTFVYARPAGPSDVVVSVEMSADGDHWTAVGVRHERISTNGGWELWTAGYSSPDDGSVRFRIRVRFR